MKKLLLIWLFSGSLDGFSQDTSYGMKSLGLEVNTTIDTVRASLLRTLGHMGVSHQYDGYAVFIGETVVAYLDDQKRPFKPPIKIWGCQRILTTGTSKSKITNGF